MSGSVHETITVPVEGGDLAVGVWGRPGAPVVLAAHGITGNHLQFAPLAAQLTDHRLAAPDLRGRAGSGRVPGPYGMTAHAQDLVAIADHMGAATPVVVGVSMGAYAAAVMAAKYPDRVERLVLVDGGISLGIDVGFDIDAVLDAVIGPAIARLSMEFESVEAHREFWKAHPALVEDWSPLIEASVDYDLVGTPPKLHSSVSHDAVRVDGAANLADDLVLNALDLTTCPVDLLHAERGMLNQTPGLFTEEMIAPFRERLGERLRVHFIEGVNHYTIALSDRGAARIADVIRAGRA